MRRAIQHFCSPKKGVFAVFDSTKNTAPRVDRVITNGNSREPMALAWQPIWRLETCPAQVVYCQQLNRPARLPYLVEERTALEEAHRTRRAHRTRLLLLECAKHSKSNQPTVAQRKGARRAPCRLSPTSTRSHPRSPQ